MSLIAHPELAASGKLRVGINFGNALLANRDNNGNPRGIAVDLAQELGKRLQVPSEIVSYATAGRMADGAKAAEWDVAFLAADPERAAEITFTPPYLEIDTTYLVPADSRLHSVADVDQEGIRIAVSEKSAYDLFLTREVHHAELVRVPGVNASVEMFFASKLEALAGLKPLLIEVAEAHPGSRVLEGRFTAVQQAIGVPRSRGNAVEYLIKFVEDIKISGLVMKLVERNGIRGVSVPV